MNEFKWINHLFVTVGLFFFFNLNIEAQVCYDYTYGGYGAGGVTYIDCDGNESSVYYCGTCASGFDSESFCARSIVSVGGVGNLVQNGSITPDVITGNQTICIGGSTTFATTATGGTWTSSDPSIATVNSFGVVVGLAFGSATITYNLISGCYSDPTRIVTVIASPSAGIITGEPNLCELGSTIYSSSQSGGTWTSSNTSVATINATTGLINAVGAGTSTITYTVLGSNGCPDATATAVITITSPVYPGALSGTQSICVGSTTTFTSTQSGGSWSSDNPAIASVNTTTGLVTGVATGTTLIRYSITSGGCLTTTNRTITVTAPPIAGAISGNLSFCAGSTSALTTTGTGGTWASSNTGIASVNSATGLVTGVGAGTATITYTVLGTGGCPDVSTTAIVTVSQGSNAGVLSGTQTICVGGSTSFSSSESGGTWSSSNTFIATVDAVTGVISGLSAGSVTIDYTVPGSGSCPNVTVSRTLTVDALPVANAGADVTTTCTNPTATLNATGGGMYSWSPAAGLSSTTISNPVADPVVTTTYTLTITGANGCVATDNIIVTVDEDLPVANAGADVTTTCINPTATLNATGGGMYSWSPAAGLSSTTISNPVADPVVTTTYTVTITGANGCVTTDNIIITVDEDLPVANAGADVTTTCTNPTATLNATGGGTYSWSPAAGLSNTTISNPVADPAVTTTYTVTITGANGCVATDNIIVTVDEDLPVANAGADVTTTCLNPTATLNATGGGTYSWLPAAGLSSTTISNPVADPVVTTSYTVTITGANGCVATDNIIVTVDEDLPVANAGADVTTTCINPTATLNATGGGTYSWSPAAGLSSTTISNPVADPVVTTTYTVTVSLANGCSATDDVIVTVDEDLPIASFTSQSACEGSPIQFTDQSNTSSSPIISWFWDFGNGNTSTAENPSFVFDSGNSFPVSLTVTSMNGCQTVVIEPAIIHPKPIPSFSGVNLEGCSPVCPEILSTSTVTGSNSISSYTWLYSDGFSEIGTSTGNCFTNSSSTTETIDLTLYLVTDQGCTDSLFVEDYISVYPLPVANFSYSPTNPSILNPVINFDNQSINSDSYVWTIGSLYSSSTENIQFEFPYEPGYYEVELIASTLNSCHDTIRETILLEGDVIIYVPNTFTPDGNESNQIFQAVISSGIDLSTFHMTIFNRWGELVFESFDFNDGWDGTYLGYYSPDGTYTWVIEYKFLYSDYMDRLVGHVNLLR